MIPRVITAALLLATGIGQCLAQQLRVAVVQMVQAPTLAGNRDRIIAGIAEGAKRGARVVVLPEAALMGEGSDQLGAVDAAVSAIRRATAERNVYVMFGATTHTTKQKKDVNWMLVLDPKGRDVLRYDKLYDQPTSPMPGVFRIDGIPCSTMICADRWLRGLEEVPIQQGAQVSFELSCNSAIEWVAPFEWYWYVPRAVRNNVWVIFANTGNTISGVAPYPGGSLRHGHSAIIAPDGRMVASAADDVGTVLVADIDVREATRTEALARSQHPALQEFWAAGMKRQSGQDIVVPPFTPLKSPAIEITIAAAQVVDDVAAMEEKIREARRRNADMIAFPARAAPESALARLQAAARASNIVVVFGAEHRAGAGLADVTAAARGQHARGAIFNSAFVIGADGALLTRYDQLSATEPFERGVDPAAMWFSVKGVPAVVTVGHDGLWSELAELAALGGAQIQVHLEHDRATGAAARLQQQVWCNLASFLTFTATVNVTNSMIWDDLRGLEERRLPAGERLAESGEAEVYSQFSANLVSRGSRPGDLLVVTRRVNAANLYHSRTIARKNPQMEPWYRFGAARLQSSASTATAEGSPAR